MGTARKGLPASGTVLSVVLTCAAALGLSGCRVDAGSDSPSTLTTPRPAQPSARPVPVTVVRRAASSSPSRVVAVTIPDPRLGIKSGAGYVYLPPGYDTQPRRRYPVLYLYHGWPGFPVDWFTHAHLRQVMDALVSAGRVQPMIVVAPESGGGWVADTECLDWAHAVRLETYLTRDVVHAIDTDFRTVASRSARAAGGYSAGAFCAVNLGLRHLGEFSAVAAISPYATPGPYSQFGPKFGSYADYLANLPLHYVPMMGFPDRTAVFLAAGQRDGSILDDAGHLADALRRRGQLVSLQVTAARTHDWAGASSALPAALVFASAHLSA